MEPFLPGGGEMVLEEGTAFAKSIVGEGGGRRGGEKSAGRDQMKKLLGECRGGTDF